MIVLDTDHCVAILRGKLDPRTRVTASETLAVTAVTVAELTHGAHRSSRAADNLMRVDALLAAVNAQSGLMQLSQQALERLIARVSGEPLMRRDGQLQVYESRAEYEASIPFWEIGRREGIEHHAVAGAEISAIQPGISARFISPPEKPSFT